MPSTSAGSNSRPNSRGATSSSSAMPNLATLPRSHTGPPHSDDDLSGDDSPLGRIRMFATPTLPSIEVRFRFSDIERRRRSNYEKHEMIQAKEYSVIMTDHLVREAMRRHVQTERLERPERHRRSLRVKQWLTILYAVSPIYTFSDAARRMQALIILRRVLVLLWYRKWKRKQHHAALIALLEQKGEFMHRPRVADLQKHKFFDKIPLKILENMVKAMKPDFHHAGENFILEGDPRAGNGLWVIETGTVRVMVRKTGLDFMNKRRSEANCDVLTTLTDGDYFGEFSLLSGEPRMATIRCETDVCAWHLTEPDFYAQVNSLQQDPTPAELINSLLKICLDRRLKNIKALYTVTPSQMRNTSVFREWRDEQLREVIRHFQPFVAHAGEVILREGEPGDAMYMIARGRVEIYTDIPQYTQLAILQPGQIFGEIACLFLEPRSASARCLTNCDIWFLPKQLFRDFMLSNALNLFQAKAAANALRAQWIPKLPARYLTNCSFFKARYGDRLKRVCNELMPLLTPRVWAMSDMICERNCRVTEWIFFLAGDAEGVGGVPYPEGAFIGGDERGAWSVWPDTIRAKTKVSAWILSSEKLRDVLERFPPAHVENRRSSHHRVGGARSVSPTRTQGATSASFNLNKDESANPTPAPISPTSGPPATDSQWNAGPSGGGPESARSAGDGGDGSGAEGEASTKRSPSRENSSRARARSPPKSPPTAGSNEGSLPISGRHNSSGSGVLAAKAASIPAPPTDPLQVKLPVATKKKSFAKGKGK